MPKLQTVLGNEQVVARFQFKRAASQRFTELFRPEIEVQIWSAKFHEWQRTSMLIDTGADYSLLPRYIAVLLGLDLRAIKPTTTTGIGGQGKVYFVPDLKIKIGDSERTIPVGFIDDNKLPPLLGRQAALETFSLVLRQRHGIYFGE